MSLDIGEELATTPSFLRLRSGVDYTLEDDADRWLAEGRRAGKPCEDDYLSRDQLHLRQAKEVYNQHGWSDEALIVGMFRRAYNPHSSQRPTKARLRGSDD